MFTFERSREPFSLGKRSREPCPTCLCSSLSDTMFMFERSREPCPTLLLVYARAESRTLTPCLRSSGVENPALLVHVRAESRTLRSLFTFERSREPWHHVHVRAESRTLCYLTQCLSSSGFENPALLVYVRAESRTFLLDRRSREPSFE
jgi:hypothetical protein